VEVNQALSENPALVNQSPFEEGWMIKMKPSNPDEVKSLMSNEDYQRFLEEHHS
jgi:glycine cleavage system H protein